MRFRPGYAIDAEDIKLLTSSGANPTLITELLKTYTAGLALLHAIKPFELQEANMVIARMHNPLKDGITVQELVHSLGRCNACDQVMAHHLVGIHDCRTRRADCRDALGIAGRAHGMSKSEGGCTKEMEVWKERRYSDGCSVLTVEPVFTAKGIYGQKDEDDGWLGELFRVLWMQRDPMAVCAGLPVDIRKVVTKVINDHVWTALKEALEAARRAKWFINEYIPTAVKEAVEAETPCARLPGVVRKAIGNALYDYTADLRGVVDDIVGDASTKTDENTVWWFGWGFGAQIFIWILTMVQSLVRWIFS
ncbi:hypothetical protein FA95DRAFT_1577840 [Auriscalpium vulgare]|uniref:Uncharacterized protein n=1 Tax=Auriscalpium vulgare TaxID=40419 RepID=A0ACB8R570_9AGAM|nr:hypothetical protein FA95DRAFT_1577840 [Auriscalpium vulgare]